MTVPLNPFGEIERFVGTLSRQFEDASRELVGGDPLVPFPLALGSMAVDVLERDEEFVATVDLPGFDDADVDVQVTDRTVRIQADREAATDTEEVDGRYIQRERRFATRSRTIRLPAEVDAENVAARMDDGVLEITLPKLASGRGRDVEIEVEM